MLMSQEHTRISLLRRLQDGGSHDDWEVFTRFYWHLVRGWAKLYHCPEPVIEDIYQNTMIAVMGALPSFRHSGRVGCFRAWLKTIVRRRVMDYFRSRAGRELTQSAIEPVDEDRDEPVSPVIADSREPEEHEFDRIWLRQIMHNAFENVRKRVKPEKFESFKRYVIYEEPVEKVSRELGIREGTIFQHKSHFLDLLRREFIKQLQDYQDIDVNSVSSQEFQKYLRNVIEDYLQTRRQLRQTALVESPKIPVGRDVPQIHRLLTQHQIPDHGQSLVIIGPNNIEPVVYPLKEGMLSIGARDDMDIVLDSPGVSGHHANLITRDMQSRIIDQHSTNGTFVNGRRVGEWPLTSGDCIAISIWHLYYLDADTPIQEWGNRTG
ncbi:MAG: sigma-70 family RNA polymerase sigma factor [Lentisphaerae bacterium]|nr:MAG: sigma-70 family RNA polymerase sigma factor [Lentisphaerota bacterium]